MVVLNIKPDWTLSYEYRHTNQTTRVFSKRLLIQYIWTMEVTKITISSNAVNFSISSSYLSYFYKNPHYHLFTLDSLLMLCWYSSKIICNFWADKAKCSFLTAPAATVEISWGSISVYIWTNTDTSWLLVNLTNLLSLSNETLKSLSTYTVPRVLYDSIKSDLVSIST